MEHFSSAPLGQCNAQEYNIVYNIGKQSRMQTLKKLHKSLKQNKPLKDLITLLDQLSVQLTQKSPTEFCESADHARICQEIEKMKLQDIEECFQEMSELPDITAIILKADKLYTLAFLMIPEGKYFGWHDHTQMNGISRIIAGRMKIRSLNPQHFTQFNQTTLLYPLDRIREETLSPHSQKLSIIYPDSYNIHQIIGLKQSCFLDLLMPEYPDNSCHYYQTCQEPIVQGEVEDKFKITRIMESAQQIIGLEKLAKFIKEKEKEREREREREKQKQKQKIKNNIIIQVMPNPSPTIIVQPPPK